MEIRGGGTSNITIAHNTFTNQHVNSSDTEHPDAIQFWTSGFNYSSSNITIDDNTITRGAGSAVQGIFMRDEVGNIPYQNVQIEGNEIIGENFNGLVVSGVNGGLISGNVVTSYSDFRSQIGVLDSTGVALNNNSAQAYTYLNDRNFLTSNNVSSVSIGNPALGQPTRGLTMNTGAMFRSAVPEPSTWTFMILGATSIGGIARRTRGQAPRAA